MTLEATYVQEGEFVNFAPTAAVSAGQVIQLPDGRAAFSAVAVAAGDTGSFQVCGVVEVAKTTTMVVLIGSRLFWDHSANKAHLLHRNDRDYYLGQAAEDATSAATTVRVHLNRQVAYTATLRDGFASLPINTAGFPFAHGVGDGVNLGFSATAEAQKVDALSFRGFAPATPVIVDALICINTIGDDTAFDFNCGVANDTHATDADSITESVFVHLNNALDIFLESDDGTTEVAATDSTVNAVAGTPFLVQWDFRNNADIQVYIDGVNVLPSSVFKVDAAAGPLKLLAHMEKTSNDSPGNMSVLVLGYRSFEA